MNICGYINCNHLFDTETNCLNALKERNCSVVYSERNDGFSGREWKNFVYALGRGDTAVFISFGSVFGDTLHFAFFFKFCCRNGIRIISIEDGVDTDCLDAMKSLAAVVSIPVSGKKAVNDAKSVIETETLLKPHDVKVQRLHSVVLNMYNADYGIGMIMDVTGYRSKCPIYRILEKYHVVRKHQNKIRKKGCNKCNN